MFTLHVRVIEAKELPKMDILSKSDPYCIVQISSNPKLERTSVINNTLTPRWNEEFHFPVTNQTTDVLHILMKDKDVVSADDPMSKLEISLSTLQMGVVIDQWYDMRPMKGVKKGGKIHLLLHLAGGNDTPFVSGGNYGSMYQQPMYVNQMMPPGNMYANPMMNSRPPVPPQAYPMPYGQNVNQQMQVPYGQMAPMQMAPSGMGVAPSSMQGMPMGMPMSQPGMQMGQPGMQHGMPGQQMGMPMNQPGMQMGQPGMQMGQPGMQMMGQNPYSNMMQPQYGYPPRYQGYGY